MTINQNFTVKRILVISLTNIGDVILTFPVIDCLFHTFPGSQISVVVGPKAFSLLDKNPAYGQVIVYDKKATLWNQWRWIVRMREQEFDLIVDLRNTAIPLMLKHRYRTSLWKTQDRHMHMKQKHLNRLHKVVASDDSLPLPRALYIPDADQACVDRSLSEGLKNHLNFIVLAPGAANKDKQWNPQGFRKIGDALYHQYGWATVFVGDANDKSVAEEIGKMMRAPFLNTCGHFSLTQLAALLRKSELVVSNDSAPMHLASYLNVPVVAIFGPTDPMKYGPWGRQGLFVRGPRNCPKCAAPRSPQKHCCMEVGPEEVLRSIDSLLNKKSE